MGGFIDGKKERVPGTYLKCGMCGLEMEEKNFSFTDGRGYYTYCYPCARKKSKQSRERKKLNIIKGIVPISVYEEKDNEAEKLKKDLAFLKTCFNVGESADILKKGYVVIFKSNSFIIIKNDKGQTDSLLWHDIYEIVKPQKGVLKNEIRGQSCFA